MEKVVITFIQLVTQSVLMSANYKFSFLHISCCVCLQKFMKTAAGQTKLLK